MSIEHINDHKFGLPKPDFHEIPTKGIIKKPMLLTAILGLLAATSIVLYHFYWTVQPRIMHNTKAAAQAHAAMDAKKETSESLPSTVSTGTKDSNVDVEINEGGTETFEHTKQAKKQESISAVQKQLEAQKNPKPLVKPGTYQELHTPQGIYHLVVVSYLDKKAAMQSVQQLIRKNLGVCLILPRAGEKYYRVTIGHSRTQYEAAQKLKEFKPTYNKIFILKY